MQLLEQPSQAGEHEWCDVVTEPHDYAAPNRDSCGKPVPATVLCDLACHPRISIFGYRPAKWAPAQNRNRHAGYGLRAAFVHTGMQPYYDAGAPERHPGGKFYDHRYRNLGQ